MSEPLLVAQNEALTDFLDDLLTEDVEDANLSVDEFLDNSLDESPDASPDEAINAPPVETGLIADAAPAVEPEPVLPEMPEAVIPESVTPDYGLPQVMDDGRVPVLPDWGLKPFQAMVFKVGELSLAIPLTELAGVIEWKPGQVEDPSGNRLHLGQYPHDGQSVTVVDIARLVFAGSPFDDSNQTEISQRVSRIILINNVKIGLAVDTVHEVITIQPTRVNWRSARTRRQWLAGTMLDEMIVVLDARSTAKILSNMLVEPE